MCPPGEFPRSFKAAPQHTVDCSNPVQLDEIQAVCELQSKERTKATIVFGLGCGCQLLLYTAIKATIPQTAMFPDNRVPDEVESSTGVSFVGATVSGRLRNVGVADGDSAAREILPVVGARVGDSGDGGQVGGVTVTL